MSINVLDIGVPLTAVGFTQEEIMEVLNALEQDKTVTLLPGNRVLMLKELPDGCAVVASGILPWQSTDQNGVVSSIAQRNLPLKFIRY